jgi:hypothetical protein
VSYPIVTVRCKMRDSKQGPQNYLVTTEYTVGLQAFFINFSTQIAGIHSAPTQLQLANVKNPIAHPTNLETKAEVL